MRGYSKDYGLRGLKVVDPEDRGVGKWCYPCDGMCDGHPTGKLTAVEDEYGEIRHWASSERAAKRWLRRHSQTQKGSTP